MTLTLAKILEAKAVLDGADVPATDRVIPWSRLPLWFRRSARQHWVRRARWKQR